MTGNYLSFLFFPDIAGDMVNSCLRPMERYFNSEVEIE